MYAAPPRRKAAPSKPEKAVYPRSGLCGKPDTDRFVLFVRSIRGSKSSSISILFITSRVGSRERRSLQEPYSPLRCFLVTHIRRINDVQQQCGLPRLLYVALNAATRSCGRWRINPTVLPTRFHRHLRRQYAATSGRGGKQLVCRVDPRFGDAIEKGNLPALVYPTSETVGTSALIRIAAPAHAAFQLFPGATVSARAITQQTTVGFELGFTRTTQTIPPFCLSRWVQPRTRRVARGAAAPAQPATYPHGYAHVGRNI